MLEQKIGIGVMGCASIAERLMIPAIKQHTEKFDLKAIASRSAEKAERFAKAFDTKAVIGYEELLKDDDIQLIYLPLPTALHEEWIIRCLEAGKHILAEKSLANNLASAQKIMTIAEERQLLVMEDFMYRYHRQHQFVFSRLKENALGELRLFRSSFGFPPLAEDNFRYDPMHEGGGSLLDAGAYTAHVSQWFLGNDLSVSDAHLYVDKNRNTDIYGNASLVNPSGLVAQISFGFDNFYQCNYEIWGSKGYIKADKAFTPKPGEKPVIQLNKADENIRFESEPDNHFYNILSEAHRCIIQREYAEHRRNILSQSKLLQEIREKAKIIFI